MKIGIPKETVAGETRVAVIPDSVKIMIGKGAEVLVETGAGVASGHPDAAYEEVGGVISADAKSLFAEADMVLKVQPPGTGENGSPDEVGLLREDSALLTFLQPFARRAMVDKLAARKVLAMSMELVPRISRAQNMDALSSMATVGGYKAVLMAANHFARFFPMFMTAAGTIAPARALVLGAGVAGLQAIATAKRLGAVVEAFDTRPVVKEQVESLGARFVAMDVAQEEAEDAGGYAKELSADHHKAELDAIGKRLPRTDIVITTAQIPGKPAPVLITEEMVAMLKPGSVIVDMAAETGGNCVWTKAGEVVERDGLTIIGTTNLPALMPVHASQMYSKNITNLVMHLLGENGLTFDMDDPITAGVVVTKDGAVVHPAMLGG